MLKIENTQVVGLEPAIRGMRNPMNSWAKSDSGFATDSECCLYETISGNTIDYHTEGLHLIDPGYFKDPDNLGFFIGSNDRKLMETLRDAGKDHAKYRRYIVVYADLIAPLYWWKEYDTYKIGTVANSCSTMHKIQAKEFTLDDFSHEHLDDNETCYEEDVGDPSLNPCYTSLDILKLKIKALNYWRDRYNETKDKHAWYQMIQLLDSSYNQRRTVMLNYEVLANIYHSRRNHKLDCWHTFCDWIEGLPESWIITGEEKQNA